jgi:SpoVK/Ycf46/Vps4 family AAA+-type ATPase
MNVEKRKNNVLDLASKLDAITESEGRITKLAINLVEDGDDNATSSICQIISNYARDDNKKIIQVARALKDAIIGFYGYNRVKEICKGSDNLSSTEDEKTLSELLDELNGLVGLKEVKEPVNDLITYQKVQKLREQNGLYSEKSTLHLAFIGNPGTGKTTVARIVGRVYKQIGLLSKGHFIEVSRTDLIAGYQGQTALKVKEVINRAKGGVLFIDEAYSITENNHSDSYGRECLTELTKALEDYRDDLVVIVAGYSEPMKQFFESNPGLKSRFNTFIEFGDYSADELMDILNMLAEKNSYKLSPELRITIKTFFEEAIKQNEKNFSNGRLSRNIYESLIMEHAKRVIDNNSPTIEELSLLLPVDFEKFEAQNKTSE